MRLNSEPWREWAADRFWQASNAAQAIWDAREDLYTQMDLCDEPDVRNAALLEIAQLDELLHLKRAEMDEARCEFIKLGGNTDWI